MKSKIVLITSCIAFLFNVLNAQNFRDSFFKGNWTENIGYKGYNHPNDTFNIMDFGAQNSGILLTTDEIQSAVNTCSSAGGGVVLVPKGKYHVGSLFLKDNVHLLFEDSAIFLGSTNVNNYRHDVTRVAGIEMAWPLAIINVNDAKNVKISGNGIVDGRGKPFWNKFWDKLDLYSDGGVRWALDYDCRRPRMLVVDNSTNVHVSDVTFQKSAFWTVHVVYSQQVTIDGIGIFNNIGGHGPSTDGIDIDSSDDILVEHCEIHCNDDNICLKAGRDADGLRVNRPCRYVEIRNNKIGAGAALVGFGSETSGGINHIYVHDMQCKGSTRGVRFKSARTRGGTIENILIENIEISYTPYAFEFTMNWNPAYSYCNIPERYNPDSVPDHWKKLAQRVTPEEKGYCKLRNVLISNVKVYGHAWKAFRVEGISERPIENIIFENVELHTETAGHIRNAKNWQFINSTFHIDDQKLPEIENCEGIDFVVE